MKSIYLIIELLLLLSHLFIIILGKEVTQLIWSDSDHTYCYIYKDKNGENKFSLQILNWGQNYIWCGAQTSSNRADWEQLEESSSTKGKDN